MIESDSEVIVPKKKKRKIPIVYRSNDSEEEKYGIEEEKIKREHSLRVTVTSSQTVNPNINEGFATKTQKMT